MPSRRSPRPARRHGGCRGRPAPARLRRGARTSREGRAVAALVRSRDGEAIVARFSPGLKAAVPRATVDDVLLGRPAPPPSGGGSASPSLPRSAAIGRIYLADHRWGDRTLAIEMTLRRGRRDHGHPGSPTNLAPARPEGRPSPAHTARAALPGRVVGVLGRADGAAELPRGRFGPASRLRPRRLAGGRDSQEIGLAECGLLGVGTAESSRPPAGSSSRQSTGCETIARRSQIENLRTPAGNHVVLDLGSGEYALLAHLRRGSVRVRPGQRVRRGETLGRCGNSGNSSEPHLHFHVQDRPSSSARHGGCRSPSAATWPTVRVVGGTPVQGQFLRPLLG